MNFIKVLWFNVPKKMTACVFLRKLQFASYGVLFSPSLKKNLKQHVKNETY